MRLKDTGLTAADIKALVNKYMIETYERMDFLADYAEGIYMYDENGEGCYHHADLQLSLHRSPGYPVQGNLRDHRHGQGVLSELRC